MQEIPNWIIKVIEMESLKCRGCKSEFTADNLMSISIQESSKAPHNDYLCIGLYCGKCAELMIFEVKEMSLIDFAFEILDQETSDKIRKKSKDDVPALAKTENSKSRSKVTKKKANKKGSITANDVSEARIFLEPEGLLHEDFLIALGMLPEEIEQYKYKK